MVFNRFYTAATDYGWYSSFHSFVTVLLILVICLDRFFSPERSTQYTRWYTIYTSGSIYRQLCFILNGSYRISFDLKFAAIGNIFALYCNILDIGSCKIKSIYIISIFGSTSKWNDSIIEFAVHRIVSLKL